MKINLSNLLEYNTRSWQDAFKKEEQRGGASPWGNSKYSDLKRCPFYFQFRHKRHMDLREPDINLELGGLLHEMFAKFYECVLDPKIEYQEDSIEAGMASAMNLWERVNKIVPDRAQQVLVLWNAWLELRKPVNYDADTVFASELLLEQKKPFPYSCRVDKILYDSELNLWTIREFKTAGRRDELLLSSYKNDAQFAGQIYLMETYIKRVHKGSFNIKDNLRFEVELITKTNPPRISIERVPFRYAKREWMQEIGYQYQLLQELESDYGHRPWPKCRTYNCRYCKLFDYCASGGNEKDKWRKVKKG